MGLNPGSPGSGPERKAGAKPLSHPELVFIQDYKASGNYHSVFVNLLCRFFQVSLPLPLLWISLAFYILPLFFLKICSHKFSLINMYVFSCHLPMIFKSTFPEKFSHKLQIHIFKCSLNLSTLISNSSHSTSSNNPYFHHTCYYS